MKTKLRQSRASAEHAAQIRECAACLRLAKRQRFASFFIFAIKARLKKLKAHEATNNGSQKRETGLETLHKLANTFRRMGDDANHVRLKHLKDAKIRDPWAAAADAYYNCMRTVRVLLPTPTLLLALLLTGCASRKSTWPAILALPALPPPKAQPARAMAVAPPSVRALTWAWTAPLPNETVEFVVESSPTPTGPWELLATVDAPPFAVDVSGAEKYFRVGSRWR